MATKAMAPTVPPAIAAVLDLRELRGGDGGVEPGVEGPGVVDVVVRVDVELVVGVTTNPGLLKREIRRMIERSINTRT